MIIAKNTKETFLEEILDNVAGNIRELPVDCKPRTREEYLLAEIEKNTRSMTSENNLYSIWVGNQSEYDLIDPKDSNTLYFIKKV